jgi:hypothetical protein
MNWADIDIQFMALPSCHEQSLDLAYLCCSAFVIKQTHGITRFRSWSISLLFWSMARPSFESPGQRLSLEGCLDWVALREYVWGLYRSHSLRWNAFEVATVLWVEDSDCEEVERRAER